MNQRQSAATFEDNHYKYDDVLHYYEDTHGKYDENHYSHKDNHGKCDDKHHLHEDNHQPLYYRAFYLSPRSPENRPSGPSEISL